MATNACTLTPVASSLAAASIPKHYLCRISPPLALPPPRTLSLTLGVNNPSDVTAQFRSTCACNPTMPSGTNGGLAQSQPARTTHANPANQCSPYADGWRMAAHSWSDFPLLPGRPVKAYIIEIPSPRHLFFLPLHPHPSTRRR